MTSGSHPSMPNVIQYDPRAWLQGEKLGLKAAEIVRQQKQRHDGCIRDISLEHIALDESGLVGNAGVRCPLLRQADQIGVELDSQRPGATPGGRDHVPSVPGSEVDHEVFRRHLRHIEHLLDQLRRRGDPHDVLARLADTRLDGRLRGYLSRRERSDREGDESRERPVWGVDVHRWRMISRSSRVAQRCELR